MKVALYKPITPGNIGAVARVMKNFGHKELLLINPQGNHLSEEAFQRACHGKELLEKARVITEEELFKYFVAGTTSKAYTRRAHRQAVTPEKLDFLPRNAVLLFGREDNGLPNKVLSKCNAVINILTGTEYQSLNLSHAAAIILYSLKKQGPRKKVVSKQMKNKLLQDFYQLSDLTGRQETLKGFLKNVVNRSVIYESEAKAIIGLLEELKKGFRQDIY